MATPGVGHRNQLWAVVLYCRNSVLGAGVRTVSSAHLAHNTTTHIQVPLMRVLMLSLAAQVVRTDLVSVIGSSDSVIVCTLVRTGPGFEAVCSVPAHITTTHIQVPSMQVLVLSFSGTGGSDLMSGIVGAR